MSEYVSGYAIALYSIATDAKKLMVFRDEANLIVEILTDNLEYGMLLTGKSINFATKSSLIHKAFDKFNVNFVNLMLILAGKFRFSLMTKICRKLVKLINSDLNVSEGVVYTTKLLTKETLAKFSAKMAKELKIKSLFLLNKVDHELVLGFKIVIDDLVLEDSLASRLDALQTELLLGKEG